MQTLRPNVPWLLLTDGIGLVSALLLVVTKIGGQQADQRLFIVLLTASSINIWLLFSQIKSLETILRKRRATWLVIPSVAALVTLVIQALARSYYSGTALFLFVAIWTAWLLAGRLTLPRYLPRLKVLLIGSPSFRRELETAPELHVVSLDTPPSHFQGWDIVAIDPVEMYSSEWLEWLGHADMYGVKILSAPLVLETLMGRVPFEMLNGRWAFEILHGQSNYQIWKRLFDLVAILVAAPVILLFGAAVAVVVFLDGDRPILFWQERIGKRGKVFMMVKFRTMRFDAEGRGTAFASEGDPRVTRAGRVLRKFRLDELPQFWNVLKGEMSIIGPRPEQKGFAEQFANEIPLYRLRMNLRPGITGWAQVMQGYADDIDTTRTKLQYDFYYVKHCSFLLDLRIVYKTLVTIVTGFGSR